MARADQNSAEHVQALQAESAAEQQRNDFMSSAGVQAAQKAAQDQASADRVFMQAQDEAKVKRQQLDKEAMAIANGAIDPRRAWHDASFGAKLAIGIATIVNGMVTKGNIGASPVVAMVNAICEQDMKAQEENLANRTGALATRRGLLADDVAAGRDILDFQYKSINAAYGMAENQIKAYALKYDNPVINAKAQEQLAQIHDARLKLGMDWHQQTIENSFKSQQLSLQRAHLAAANRAAAAKGAVETPAMMNAQREREKDRRERVLLGVTGPDGKQLYAKDKETATAVKNKMDATTDNVAILDEMNAIYERHKWVPLKDWRDDEAGKDARRANLLMTKLFSGFSKQEDQGTIRKEEYEMYRNAFGNPSGWLDPRAQLNTAREMFIDSANTDINQQFDEEGNVVQSAYWLPKPRLAKPKDTDTAEGNYQGRDFESVPMDKTGKIIDPEEEAYKARDAAKIKQAPPEAPRKLTDKEEMDRMYGTHQADEP